MVKLYYSYRKYGDFMVDPGTVNNDLNTYKECLTECKNKFSSLESDWKGPSFEKLSTKVESFINSANLVSTQMTNLANVCALYQQFEEKKSECDNLVALYEMEEQKEEPNSFLLQQYKKQIDEILVSMIQLNISAKSSLSNISGEVEYQSIGNTDFVSGLISSASNVRR